VHTPFNNVETMAKLNRGHDRSRNGAKTSSPLA
jgi:hypothetical protein